MIRAHVVYTRGSPHQDRLAEEFHRSRAAMIERAARPYPALQTTTLTSAGTHCLQVLARETDAATDLNRPQFADFIEELHDENLGDLDWQADTPEEVEFLVESGVRRARIGLATIL